MNLQEALKIKDEFLSLTEIPVFDPVHSWPLHKASFYSLDPAKYGKKVVRRWFSLVEQYDFDRGNYLD